MKERWGNRNLYGIEERGGCFGSVCLPFDKSSFFSEMLGIASFVEGAMAVPMPRPPPTAILY